MAGAVVLRVVGDDGKIRTVKVTATAILRQLKASSKN